MAQFKKDIEIYKNRAVVTRPYIILKKNKAILCFEKITVYDKQLIKALTVPNIIIDKMLRNKF